MFKPNSTGELICKDLELTSVPKNLFQEGDEIVLVDLRGNSLTSIEHSILFKLVNLKVLDLRSNHLEMLTDEIGYLWNLRELRLDNNHLTALPLGLFQLPSLTVLSVTKNSLFSLPDIIYKLRKLKNLSISFNQISHVPVTMLKLKRLAEVYIQNNHFHEIPTGLLSGNLKELGLEWFDYTNPVVTFKDLIKVLPLPIVTPYMTFLEFLKMFNKCHDHPDILYRAINRGDIGVIKGLIEGGVDLNSFDRDGYSPLMISIKQDKISICKMLIDAGASFKYGAGNYGSVLHIAVYKCEIWLVELLITSGIDVNMIDAEGNTPLHILMGIYGKQKFKCKRIAELIMSRNPKVNAYNHENWAPLHIAARKGYSCALKWIINQNAILKLNKKELFDVNIKGGSLDWVPLHLASHSNHFKSVEILVNAGARVNTKNLEGKVPKDTCKGNVSIFKYLLRLEKAQRHLYVKNNIEEELDNAKGISKNIAISNSSPLFLRYQNLYNLYMGNKYSEIAQLASRDKDTIVGADALYLLSFSKDKNSDVVDNII